MKVGALHLPLAYAVRQFSSRSALPATLRRKVARLLFKSERLTGGAYRIRHRGVEWAGEFVDYIDWHIFFLGGFEPEALNLCEFLSGHVDGAFVDIGANKGLYSATLAHRFSKVVAFEPDPRNVRRLRDIIARNRPPNVDVREVALGDAPGTATFHLPPEANQGTGSILPIANSRGAITVPLSTGDIELAGTRVALMKIDVEGFEAYVLRGLSTTLRRDRPFILFEIGDTAKRPFAEGGGVHAVLPPDYRIVEVPSQSGQRGFALRELPMSELLGRSITNNLAVPEEKMPILAPFLHR